MSAYRKKLIEVALPLEEINVASAREKSIRHGHPSTLHLWWARRPLATCRAVLFTSIIDDPGEEGVPQELLDRMDSLPLGTKYRHLVEEEILDKAGKRLQPQEERRLKIARERRYRLFTFIEQLVQWENSNDADTLKTAQELIHAATGGNPPPVLDPFCGGGSIPLEAQRLGLEAHGSDLNPVAVLITKAMIEIPPKFAGQPPINPKARTNMNLGARASRPHKHWHSRGYLPHFDSPGLVQSINFRLFDSVPSEVVREWQSELKHHSDERSDFSEDDRSRELRRRIANFEDSGKGACFLKDPTIAKIVENALIHFDGDRYRLLEWCIMPNHVHVLIETMVGSPLSDLVHSWKSFTAKAANQALGRTGDFWMSDYYDRFIRDAAHYAAVVEYIRQNPVRAGLVSNEADWPFSSASMIADNAGHAGIGAHAGGTPALPGMQREWQGATGLADDVRYYGKWMRDEAEKRIGHLYPKVKVTEEMAQHRPDLAPLVGQELTVIAWLWARTVKCPNPACGAQMPLVRSFDLSTKAGKQAWVEPVVDQTAKTTVFTVRTGTGSPREATVGKRGAICLCCSAPARLDYVRAEGMAKRMGAQLMAIVAAGKGGRIYLPATPEQEAVAAGAVPEWTPVTELVRNSRHMTPTVYGMTTHADLFTKRQLVTLATLSELVADASRLVREHAIEAGLDKVASAFYADAVATYLAFAADKGADYWSSLCSWHSSGEKMRNTFGRQAVPMVWDYAECNVFSESTGNWLACVQWVWKVVSAMPALGAGLVRQADAQSGIGETSMVSTDPPYYDNVPYADLSDFFYVWLRRSLGAIHPDLFATMLVPKAQELVADPFRHGGKEHSRTFFETGMNSVFAGIRRSAHTGYPVSVYYAFKQSEADEQEEENGVPTAAVASTGWETFLQGLVETGFQVVATWPMRTELGNRMRNIDSNALASCIVLACRPRPLDALTVTRRQFLVELGQELQPALATLTQGNIAPVDLAQAAIGPGMAVFSRYAAVLEPNGLIMRVRSALSLINQEIDRSFEAQEGWYDPQTRWAVAWFATRGFSEGPYGEAEVLAVAKDSPVPTLVAAGIVRSGVGKVRLLKRDELRDDYDPAEDERVTVWEAAQHLARVLDSGGELAAARLVRRFRTTRPELEVERARDLAYRLFALCEQKRWPHEARAYNALVLSWSDIETVSQTEEAEWQAPSAERTLFTQD